MKVKFQRMAATARQNKIGGMRDVRLHLRVLNLVKERISYRFWRETIDSEFAGGIIGEKVRYESSVSTFCLALGRLRSTYCDCGNGSRS